MAAAEEKMLSLEELKQEMFQSLRDTGTIDMIRVRCAAPCISAFSNDAAVLLQSTGAGAKALH